MLLQAQTGPAIFGDNEEHVLRIGLQGDLITSQLNGSYFEHLSRGNVFIYSSAAAGVTFAAHGNNLPTIWNPSDSGKLFVPIKVLVGYVSTTNAAGHLSWGFQERVGGNIGTAAPISIFTDISPKNALIGSGKQSRMRFATTVTFTAAPTYLRNVGISTAAMVATTVAAPFTMAFEEDGTLGLMPGSALQLGANGAIAMVAAVAIVGIEISLPQQSSV